MIDVDVLETQTRLSCLLSLVENGEEIVILREGKPVVRLVLFKEKRGEEGAWHCKGTHRSFRRFRCSSFRSNSEGF